MLFVSRTAFGRAARSNVILRLLTVVAGLGPDNATSMCVSDHLKTPCSDGSTQARLAGDSLGLS